MKTDTDTRVLLEVLCAWLIDEVHYMPHAVEKLREQFNSTLDKQAMRSPAKGERPEK